MARLNHHLEKSPNPRWHIDYLRKAALPYAVWFTTNETQREHEWASLLRSIPGVIEPVPGFGSSDCGCFSHLFRLSDDAFGALSEHLLRQEFVDRMC